MMFQDVRAVYFDLDDTLCGYWDAAKAALRETFELHPIPGYTTDEMTLHWAAAFRVFGADLKASGWYEQYCRTGEPTRNEQMRLTLERVGIANETLTKALGDTYARIRDERLELFPDALEVLDTLREKGYPMGLITNGPADIQRQEAQTLGIESYFNPILIEGEMGFGKPIPEVFARALAAHSLEPHQTLMVGNSYKHDILPAIEAGWRTAWIRKPSDIPPSATGDAKPEELPAGSPAPDVEIRDLKEILPLLGL